MCQTCFNQHILYLSLTLSPLPIPHTPPPLPPPLPLPLVLCTGVWRGVKQQSVTPTVLAIRHRTKHVPRSSMPGGQGTVNVREGAKRSTRNVATG